MIQLDTEPATKVKTNEAPERYSEAFSIESAARAEFSECNKKALPYTTLVLIYRFCREIGGVIPDEVRHRINWSHIHYRLRSHHDWMVAYVAYGKKIPTKVAEAYTSILDIGRNRRIEPGDFLTWIEAISKPRTRSSEPLTDGTAVDLEDLIARVNARYCCMQAMPNGRLAVLWKAQGDDLSLLKLACGHGQFERTVRTRLSFGVSLATDLMKIARHWDAKIGQRRAQNLASIRNALALIEPPKKRAPPAIPQPTLDKIAALRQAGVRGDEFASQLILGDCLEKMSDIADGSVDLIICDLPFGMTEYEWDKPVDLCCLWQQYQRIIKENRPIILFASQPYTTDLIMSNRKWFRYNGVWIKNRTTNFVHANSRFLKRHEDILIFSAGAAAGRKGSDRQMPYYPQGLQPANVGTIRQPRSGPGYKQRKQKVQRPEFTGYPDSIFAFSNDQLNLHPVAKPIALLQCLINLYSRRGELVLDNAMGSGTTGVACLNTGRRFIGIEKDEHFFEIAQQMIQASAAKAANLSGGGTQ
jgi:site-specific DNA-methyltransferase (adenine-specific)